MRVLTSLTTAAPTEALFLAPLSCHSVRGMNDSHDSIIRWSKTADIVLDSGHHALYLGDEGLEVIMSFVQNISL